VDHVGFVIS